MRHAKADMNHPDDFTRPLVEQGISNHKLVCQQLHEQGYHVSLIFSSPLARAQHSASIAAQEFGCEIQTLDSLGSSFDIEHILKTLQTLPDESSVCLVGHAPTLEGFANQLVQTQTVPRGLSTSGTYVIRLNLASSQVQGELVDYLHPGNCT